MVKIIERPLVSADVMALTLVLEWNTLHQSELLENWQLAKQRQPLKRIAPLE